MINLQIVGEIESPTYSEYQPQLWLDQICTLISNKWVVYLFPTDSLFSVLSPSHFLAFFGSLSQRIVFFSLLKEQSAHLEMSQPTASQSALCQGAVWELLGLLLTGWFYGRSPSLYLAFVLSKHWPVNTLLLNCSHNCGVLPFDFPLCGIIPIALKESV